MGFAKINIFLFISEKLFEMGAAPIFFRKIFFHFGKIYLINFLLGVRGPQY